MLASGRQTIMNLLELLLCILLSRQNRMKACTIAKQKLMFIIDVDIFETLIFGLLFNNSGEETITVLNEQKRMLSNIL